MALGADEFTELVTSTLQRIDRSQLYDNVFKRHPSLDLLRQEQSSAHGREHVINLELAENTSTQWTDKSGTFSTAVSDPIMGSAVYPWSSPLVSSVRLQWKDIKMNQGREQIVNLVKSHISNMEKSHAKTIVEALHARADLGEIEGLNSTDGPDVQDQFLSLDQLAGDADYDADPDGGGLQPAFNVGKIDSSTQTLWQAQRIELPADGAYTIRQAFRHVSNEVFVSTRTVRPDTVIAGRDIFEEFEDSFDDAVRYTNFGDGQTRFSEVKHGELAVRLDPDCPPKRAYFLARSTLDMRSLAGTFMEQQQSQDLEGNLDTVTPVASVLTIGTNERRGIAVLGRPDTAGGDF